MSPNTKKRIKIYCISILIPLAVGGLSALLTRNGMEKYAALSRPPLSPPAILFPIVWAVLYILMGISAAKIYENSNGSERKKALWIYAVQLIFNFFWSIFFFGAGLRLLALIWLFLLLLIVILMYFAFDKISHGAAYLQISYVLWLCFAAYLNFGTWFLNR